MHLSLSFGCALEDIRVGCDFSHWPWYNTREDLAPSVLEEQEFHLVLRSKGIQQISSRIQQD